MPCRKKLFAIFKVKVTAKAHIIKIYDSFFSSSELLNLLQPNLVWLYIIISQSVLWKKNWLLHSRPRSQGRVKMSMFVHLISTKPQTFCYQTWYCGVSSWAGVSCKKIGLLFSRSRSQQWLIWLKYDIFYYIFWTADPFATKLGLIVLHLKPECLMMKLDCCVQDHSKISKCQRMFF